ncbi:amino acid ABC transporter ATP-binding protein (PAAT family) [Psychrobacillus insolitus]|uniref:Amino acid ABC transporter ATP-binding protein (PAAT family) n=1 Tax=Psychrobacillus insolitus TaxID=1461 RepID=A0A2W7MLV9_9BACI|nr:amino acid ABC transporter ATP-binding protein [Psychrobacillus insolitus]PZX07770.1 amino acid ABC transporter ATP-binding protein (PAAT family) [Psychrobacillus insolitus]
MIQANDLSKSYDQHEVLKHISLTIPAHQVVAVIGPSGSGKSTFLRCLNGLETITGGSVSINNHLLKATDKKKTRLKTIHEIRQDTGMVFQQFNLYPHKTVIENVMEALIIVKKQSKSTAKTVAAQLLKRVGLQEKEDVYPSKLSGGQQQRVAIARALAMEPKIMLFDEPTSALDPELVGEVLKVMKELADEGMTMVIVTHEMRFAESAADRILFMADGQIVEDSEPKAFFAQPATERAQKFLAKVNEF